MTYVTLDRAWLVQHRLPFHLLFTAARDVCMSLNQTDECMRVKAREMPLLSVVYHTSDSAVNEYTLVRQASAFIL